jgi:hypothetical protein
MCEPTTIALLALAASTAGSFVAMQGQNAMVEQQAETANNNTREGYRVAQENDRAAQAQAFEQQTDRMRKAAQDLSVARVVAAEGGGSLAARAINIAAGADEDYSRIDASLSNQRSSIRGQIAAAQTQNADAMTMASSQFKANQIRFFSDVGQAAVSAGTGYHDRQEQLKLAQNKVYDKVYRGTRGIGD